MDQLNALRIFVRIVEHRSFTRAADELGLPRSSVTDAIKALEQRLGAQLLHRTTRRVAPTVDGELYHARCVRLLGELDDAESELRAGEPRGTLRVHVQGTLARNVLIPALPDFLRRYPAIELHLGEGDAFVDAVLEGVDCVLRSGEPRAPDMIVRRVATLDETTLASRAYIDAHGLPPTIEALHDGHRMVGFHSSATGSVLPLEFTEKTHKGGIGAKRCRAGWDEGHMETVLAGLHG